MTYWKIAEQLQSYGKRARDRYIEGKRGGGGKETEIQLKASFRIVSELFFRLEHTSALCAVPDL